MPNMTFGGFTDEDIHTTRDQDTGESSTTSTSGETSAHVSQPTESGTTKEFAASIKDVPPRSTNATAQAPTPTMLFKFKKFCQKFKHPQRAETIHGGPPNEPDEPSRDATAERAPGKKRLRLSKRKRGGEKPPTESTPPKRRMCGPLRKLLCLGKTEDEDRPAADLEKGTLDPAPDCEPEPETRPERAPEPPQELSDDERDAQIWGSTRSIDEVSLVKLAVHHLGSEKGIRCWFLEAREGSYNRANIVQFSDGSKYIIRVPACGSSGRWNEDDAVAFRSQALTMRYLRRNTGLPLPDVIAYDTTPNNEIGHPYMLMNYIEGKRVSDVWDDSDYSPAQEAQRQRILKSLAETMSRLQHISFDSAGMLYFDSDDDDDPKVGPKYQCDEGTWHDDDFGIRHNTSFTQTWNSSQDHFRRKLEKWWEGRRGDPDYVGEAQDIAAYKLYSIILDCFPFSTTTSTPEDPSETFVLVPPDFNCQNILVDDDDNVVGLLDWDGVSTCARFQGWAASPDWLSEDYSGLYTWDGKPGSGPRGLEQYRKSYAKYMAEVMNGKGDCKYTARSHLFDAVVMALNYRELTQELLEKILSVILPRVRYHDYLAEIGGNGGFRPGEEEWFKENLRELFACKAGPDERFSF